MCEILVLHFLQFLVIFRLMVHRIFNCGAKIMEGC
jgi:hypothetical protein